MFLPRIAAGHPQHQQKPYGASRGAAASKGTNTQPRIFSDLHLASEWREAGALVEAESGRAGLKTLTSRDTIRAHHGKKYLLPTQRGLFRRPNQERKLSH